MRTLWHEQSGQTILVCFNISSNGNLCFAQWFTTCQRTKTHRAVCCLSVMETESCATILKTCSVGAFPFVSNLFPIPEHERGYISKYHPLQYVAQGVLVTGTLLSENGAYIRVVLEKVILNNSSLNDQNIVVLQEECQQYFLLLIVWILEGATVHGEKIVYVFQLTLHFWH